MAEKVEIVIEAEDNASKTLSNVNEELASLGSVARGEALARLKDAGIEAFQGMASAAGEFIDAAAEAEMVGVRMEATLRALGDAAPTTAEEINSLADELSKLTGFDDEELVAAQATLARIGSVSEDSFERATRAAVDLAAATGMDLNSAFTAVGIAVQNADFGRLARQIGDLPPEMQEAAKAALEMGDTLKAQEIVLTGIEQKVQGTGEAMGNTFTGALNKMEVEFGNWKEKVGQPMIDLFLKLPEPVRNTGYAIYGMGQTFAPAISGFANMAIAAAALKGALGVGAAGAAAGGGGIAGALGGIKVALAGIIPTLGLVVAAIGGFILEWNVLPRKIAELDKAIWDSFGVKLPSELQAINDAMIEKGPFSREYWTAVSNAINTGMTLISQDIGTELDGFTSLVEEKTVPVIEAFSTMMRSIQGEDAFAVEGGGGTVSKFLQSLGMVRTAAQDVENRMWWISRAISGIFSALAVEGDRISLAFEDGSGAVMYLMESLGMTKAAAQDFGQKFYASVQSIIEFTNAIKGSDEALQHLPYSVSYLLRELGVSTEVAQKVADAFTAMTARIRDSLNNAVTAATSAAAKFATVGKAIVDGIWNGIQSAWNTLKSNVGTALNSLLAWVENSIDAGSPSKVWADAIGKPMAQGIGVGFKSALAGVSSMAGASLQPGRMMPATAAVGNSGGTTIVLNYSPGVAISDRQDTATRLVPYIQEAMRKIR